MIQGERNKIRFEELKRKKEGIGDYAAMALINGGQNYNDQSGIAPSQLPNPNLKWEQTKQSNVGLDFGFLGNRISASADYFIKKTLPGGLLRVVGEPDAP